MWDRRAAETEAEAEEAEAAVRSVQCCFYRQAVRQSIRRQSTVDKEEKGLQGGIKRKRQKMGV